MRGTRNHKAQSSMEYMIIVGFAFLLVVPILILFYDSLHDMQDNVNTAQVDAVIETMVRTADKIYYMGTPAMETVKVTYPTEFTHMEILDNNTIYITYEDVDTGVDIPAYRRSVAPLQGVFSMNEGIHFLRIEAKDGYVLITDVS